MTFLGAHAITDNFFDVVERAEHRRAAHDPRIAGHVFDFRDRRILVERRRHREQAPMNICRLGAA